MYFSVPDILDPRRFDFCDKTRQVSDTCKYRIPGSFQQFRKRFVKKQVKNPPD